MPRRRSGQEGRLFSAKEYRLVLVGAYYAVLAEDPRIRAGLEHLYKFKRSGPSDKVLVATIVAFCVKWRLPRETGPQDVLLGLLHREDRAEDGDRIGPAFAPIAISWWPSVEQLASTLPDRPTTELALRTPLMAELRDRGIAPIPPQHHSTSVLIRHARRLYRRAVLELAWGQIAEIEHDHEWSRRPTVEAIRRTVGDWAKQLNVPLPVIPAGRPKSRLPESRHEGT